MSVIACRPAATAAFGASRSLCYLIPGSLALLLGASTANANEEQEGHRTSCARLTRLRFEGNTTVTAATEVTSGTLTTPTGQVLTNLPDFCRVEGLSRPTRDSNIYFEVWLPTRTWNLSSGEGGYAGALNYTRLGWMAALMSCSGGVTQPLRRIPGMWRQTCGGRLDILKGPSITFIARSTSSPSPPKA
jgi:hypothetical protein